MSKEKKNAGKFSKQPQNLQRFKYLVEDFVSKHEDPNDKKKFKKAKKTISRKDRRKEERVMKKIRNKAFSQRKPVSAYKGIQFLHSI